MSKANFESKSKWQINWYTVCVIAIVSFALGFLIGGPITQDEESVIYATDWSLEQNMISEQEAIERAKEWLQQRNMQFEGREIIVHRKDAYTVSFLLPDGMLGGDWTLRIDANTGEVFHATIER